MPRRYLLPLNVESVPLASLYPFPFLVHLGVACNGHYEVEKQPPLNSIVCSNSDLPKLYIKHPREPLSPLVRSPLLLEFFPLSNLSNCSPEFTNSGDLSPCVQEAIYHHNLFKWFTSSSSTLFRTRPSTKHTGATFFLVSGDKSGEHPASESQSATCPWPIFSLFLRNFSKFRFFTKSSFLYIF